MTWFQPFFSFFFSPLFFLHHCQKKQTYPNSWGKKTNEMYKKLGLNIEKQFLKLKFIVLRMALVCELGTRHSLKGHLTLPTIQFIVCSESLWVLPWRCLCTKSFSPSLLVIPLKPSSTPPYIYRSYMEALNKMFVFLSFTASNDTAKLSSNPFMTE